jgi:hypothetical protein
MSIELIGILKLAKETVGSFFAHRQTVANKAWDGVVLALDKVSELTTLHVKAVAEVTAPILSNGDIGETSRRYNLLINNPDFPQGYGEARGILDAAKRIPAFRDPAIQEMIRAVLQDLYEFQYGVFTLGWDSYHVSDAIAECARVAASSQVDPDQIALAGDPLIKSYTYLFEDESTQGIPARTNSISELIGLVKAWCQAWQRYIQRSLYGGRGLNYSIGQLRMQRR